MLNRDQIKEMIPHAGTMSLLDSVLEWSDEKIICESVSQTDPDNPLKSDGRLSAINGVEYAAQAMAVHGALLQKSDEPPGVAFLAALRSVNLHCDYLDGYDSLQLDCQRLGGDNNGFIYAFEVKSNDQLLLDGRATVITPKDNQ